MRGLAPDGGLYMPYSIPKLPKAFFSNLKSMSLKEMAFAVTHSAFSGDIPGDVLQKLVNNTFSFDMPLRHIAGNHYVMELFHGPTMAFKDVGARFLGGLLRYYMQQQGGKSVNVLVPTSGDTGAAVAGGLHNVPGVNVWVLYPENSISYIQEAQFASLGGNVHALEVKGSFDHCKSLVEQAFKDKDLNQNMLLTSATSINVARIVPQVVYYFWAYAQLAHERESVERLVFSVPCANLGNLVSGLVARELGLPIDRFVAVENINHVFYDYMQTGSFDPQRSVASIAPALDAGNPTNFERIVDMTGSIENARTLIHARTYDDSTIEATMRDTYDHHSYMLDPHSAFAYRGLCDDLHAGEIGISLATAHPAKFASQVENALGEDIDVPRQLSGYLGGMRQVTSISHNYNDLRTKLMTFGG